MATSTYLASTLVMGCIGVVVALALARGRTWQSYTPQAVGTASGGVGILDDDRLWILGFVVLAIGATLGTLVVLGGSGGSGTLIVLGAGLLLSTFLVLGTYTAARSRGHPHSHAVGEAMAAIGAVVILAITLNLVTSFGL